MRSVLFTQHTKAKEHAEKYLPDYFDWVQIPLEQAPWGDKHLTEEFLSEKSKDVYAEHGNRVDALFFILKDWREDFIGLHLGEQYMGYEVGLVKHRPRWWRTLYHELMHTVDNITFKYTGVKLSEEVDVREWDEDVVHGRNKHFVEYRYDDVFRQIREHLDKAISTRRKEQNWYYKLIIQLREFQAYLKRNPEVIMADGSSDKMDMWAEGIKEFEGWKPGSLTYRLNNPGALRWSPFQDGKSQGFSYFNTYDKGWKALTHQLELIANGTSNAYNAAGLARFGVNGCENLTIRQWVDIWAPPGDNNYHNDRYAQYIADKVGETTDTRVKHLT